MTAEVAPGGQGGGPLRRRRFVGWAAGLVLVAGAGIGFAECIVMTGPDPQLIGKLVVQRGPVGFAAHASTRQAVPQSDIFPTPAKRAAGSQPTLAGQFAADWKGTKAAKGAEAALTLTLLPSDASARQVLTKIRAQYMATKKIAADGYSVTGRFAVASIPGSQGVSVTTTTKKSHTTVIAYRQGRAVVLADVQSPDSARRAAATGLARDESALLRSELGGFSMVQTHVPLVASLVYWVSAAAIVLICLVGPGTTRRFRTRRREARQRRIEAARRRERMARGRKVVRRQGSFR